MKTLLFILALTVKLPIALAVGSQPSTDKLSENAKNKIADIVRRLEDLEYERQEARTLAEVRKTLQKHPAGPHRTADVPKNFDDSIRSRAAALLQELVVLASVELTPFLPQSVTDDQRDHEHEKKTFKWMVGGAGMGLALATFYTLFDPHADPGILHETIMVLGSITGGMVAGVGKLLSRPIQQHYFEKHQPFGAQLQKVYERYEISDANKLRFLNTYWSEVSTQLNARGVSLSDLGLTREFLAHWAADRAELYRTEVCAQHLGKLSASVFQPRTQMIERLRIHSPEIGVRVEAQGQDSENGENAETQSQGVQSNQLTRKASI